MKRLTAYVLIGGCLALVPGASPLAAGEVPEECAEHFAEQIREMVDYIQERGWIGIEYEGDPPILTRVISGGPAEAGGLEPGDVWLGVSGFEFAGREKEEVWKRVKGMILPGKDFIMVVEREGRRLELAITPIEVPHHIMAQWIGGHLLEKHAADLIGKEE